MQWAGGAEAFLSSPADVGFMVALEVALFDKVLLASSSRESATLKDGLFARPLRRTVELPEGLMKRILR